jgi:hypothetical protein
VVPLRAEAVVDAIQTATGSSLGRVALSRKELRAVEIPVARTGSKKLDLWFEVFNRPERELTCDCEQQREPTLRQTMLLLSDQELLTRILDGSIGEFLELDPTDGALVDEMFLRTLSRWPISDERRVARDALREATDRLAACGDIIWGLINTREFITNH